MLLLSSEPAANRLARIFFSLIHPFRALFCFSIFTASGLACTLHIPGVVPALVTINAVFELLALPHHFFFLLNTCDCGIIVDACIEVMQRRSSNRCLYEIGRSIDRKSSQNGENGKRSLLNMGNFTWKSPPLMCVFAFAFLPLNACIGLASRQFYATSAPNKSAHVNVKPTKICALLFGPSLSLALSPSRPFINSLLRAKIVNSFSFVPK